MARPIYRLTFILPRELALILPLGRHHPCLAGCVLTLERSGLVVLEGPSRDSVFDQVGRFLRLHNKGRPPLTVVANLRSIAGSDSWTIIVGASVSIVPTSIPGRTYDAMGRLMCEAPARGVDA